jgi:predicted enzyme related to lactoylglutathione lyase
VNGDKGSGTSFDLVTIDSPATDAIAAFWSAVLDLHEVEREDGDRWIVLADASGRRRMGVQTGATRPGSMHLDVACAPDDFDDELERIVGLGAEQIGASRHEPYGSIVNLLDPDGNPFDLCAYV